MTEMLKTSETTEKLLKFIDASPSCFHAVKNICVMLEDAGCIRLLENETWALEKGKRYFTTRNGSSVLAFSVPENYNGMQIVSAHSDSPTFRVKSGAEIIVEGHYKKLNTEGYGGMILSTWFDRPLSLAGRAVVRTESGVKSVLLNIDRDLCIIPSLTDSNLNHTGIYLYSKGKIMIHLTFDYKTDEKCTTPGQYLKYHRTFQGFTTRELAEKVGIVPATLVLYENDRHPIKHSTAVALANALGIDRNRLLDKYTAFVDYPYSSLLKKVRQELSLTQMQMAEVIGIGQTSYSGWEREIRVPRRKEYEKILAALKKLKVNVDTYLCHPAST